MEPLDHLTPPREIAKQVVSEKRAEQSWPRRHVGLIVTFAFVTVIAVALFLAVRLFPPPPDAATMQQLQQLQQRQDQQLDTRSDRRDQQIADLQRQIDQLQTALCRVDAASC